MTKNMSVPAFEKLSEIGPGCRFFKSLACSVLALFQKVSMGEESDSIKNEILFLVIREKIINFAA